MWQNIKCDICGMPDLDLQISQDIDKIYRCGQCRDIYMFGRSVDGNEAFERMLKEDFRQIEPINVG